MNKFSATLFVFTLLLTATLFAQSPQKEGTAIITGQVTLKGEAVPGAAVALSPYSGTARFELKNVRRVKTDEAGRFRFEGVKAGRYYLGAITPGYVTPGENLLGAQGKAITVAEGETIENYELALKPGGVITGKVTDFSGNPLVGEGVGLSLLNQAGKPERFSLGVNGNLFGIDDRGIYRIYGLPAGRYLVSVGFEQRPNAIAMTSRRVFYPLTYHSDATNESDAKVVEVTEGKETTGVDITVGGLKKNFDLSGRVAYAESGQPAVNIEVSYGVVSSNGKTIGPSASTGERTNAQGEFRIQNILPGKYSAFARPDKGDPNYSEATPFEISDGDASGVEIKLRAGGSISGTASFEGITDPAMLSELTKVQLFVSINSQNLAAPNVRNLTYPGANGSFRFEGLVSGKAAISLGATSRSRGFSLLRIERGSALITDGIEISQGEHISGVRLVIGNGNGSVRGQLKVIGGVLPDKVRLVAVARRVESGLTAGSGAPVDPPGVFRIEKLPPGEYEIVLNSYPQTNEPFPGYEELAKLISATKQRVTISNGVETPVTLTLDLSRREGN